MQSPLPLKLKTKVPQQTYVDSCNTILESDLDDSGKFSALQTYASQFTIATETDMLNDALKNSSCR